MEKLKLTQIQSIRQESFSPASPGDELTIDLVSGAITGSARFFSTYEINNIQSWVQAILMRTGKQFSRYYYTRLLSRHTDFIID